MSELLSIVVLTFNSEYHIEKCLKSVKWADEIIVIDSFSEDKTVDLAKSLGAKVIQKAYPGYSKQLEFGVEKTSNKWVLILDSDEVVSNDLADEIKKVLENPPSNIGGYEISRKVFFLGQWINHGGWFPDYQFRLINKELSYAKHLEVHGSYTTDKKKEKLKSLIYHYTYRNLYDYLKRINIYTTLNVSDKINNIETQKVKWYNLILNPISAFLRTLIVNKGYKDKMPGLILALFSAFYTLALYAKIWEYQYSKKNDLELPPITNSDLQKYRVKEKSLNKI